MNTRLPSTKAHFTFCLAKRKQVAENFESSDFYTNLEIDHTCLLYSHAFVSSSTYIRLETFWMVVEMAKDSLLLACRAWGEFQSAFAEVKKTYRAHAMVFGWLAMYFTQAHSKYVLQTRINLFSFVLCMATFSLAQSDEPSRIVWYMDQVTLRPYDSA